MRNRSFENDRSFGNPELYKKWRQSVFRRDHWKCRMPGCKNKGKIYAHHIRRYADNPELAFDLKNGLTLCKQHHDSIWGKEDEFASLFLGLITSKESMDLFFRTKFDE